VGRWGWFGPTCQRGGSAGRTGKGQNHAVERCPYAFFRGRDCSAPDIDPPLDLKNAGDSQSVAGPS
jgi:hypothetical protein